MKYLLTLALFVFSFSSFSQSEKIECGQIPMGNVDKKAVIKDDFNKKVTTTMDASLREDGSHQAIFKAYVDCNGDVLKSRFEKGDLDDAQQKWLYNLIQDSKWTSAKLDGKAVTTIVFVTIDINNGQVTTSIQ